MFNRKMYKDIKKYDREQMQKFCENLYSQGFKDGSEAGNNTDLKTTLSEILIRTPGIGDKIYNNAMNILKEMEAESNGR